MSPLEWLIIGISLVNVGMAVAIGVIYWRVHRTIRSPFTWVLLLFAAFLIVHNAFQVYSYFTMLTAFREIPETFLAVEGALETATTVALLAAALR